MTTIKGFYGDARMKMTRLERETLARESAKRNRDRIKAGKPPLGRPGAQTQHIPRKERKEPLGPPDTRRLRQQWVKRMLKYDPATGALERVRQPGSVAKDRPIGHRLEDGRMRVSLLGRHYYANKLAWLYVHGEYPAQFIEHINGDKSDIRIENMRLRESPEKKEPRRAMSDMQRAERARERYQKNKHLIKQRRKANKLGSTASDWRPL
jgi:hypothetical protein